MPTTNVLKRANLLALLIPAILLGGAYVAQYGFGLAPCEMCWWQRYPHFAALVLAAAALFAAPGMKKPLILLAALAIAISGAIAVFHAGVEYHWWEGLTRCSTGGGVTSLDDLMSRPLIRCDVAAWTLFGVSLAGFNAILSLGGALAVILLLKARAR